MSLEKIPSGFEWYPHLVLQILSFFTHSANASSEKKPNLHTFDSTFVNSSCMLDSLLSSLYSFPGNDGLDRNINENFLVLLILSRTSCHVCFQQCMAFPKFFVDYDTI